MINNISIIQFLLSYIELAVVGNHLISKIYDSLPDFKEDVFTLKCYLKFIELQQPK